MEDKLLDDPLITNRWPQTLLASSVNPSNELELKAQALADLLRNKVLSQVYGEQGEYEVRTTFTTRHAWRYRCSVLHHGKVFKRAFPPVQLDRTREMRKVVAVTQEMRLALAAEAVDVHFARCEAVKEYLILAAIFLDPPARRHTTLRMLMTVLMCTALAVVYWFWQKPIHAALNLSPFEVPAPVVQWERKEVFYTPAAGKPFMFPLPALNSAAADLPIEVRMESLQSWPTWIYFNRDRLRISGIAPTIKSDQTYYLALIAKVDGSKDSQLDVYLTVIGEEESLYNQPWRPSMPTAMASPHADSSVEGQDRLEPGASSAAAEPVRNGDCLLKILRGEPC